MFEPSYQRNQVSLPDAGIGTVQAVPAGATNGTALSFRPASALGVRFYFGPGDSVSYTLSGAAPLSAPAATSVVTIAGPGVFDEPFPPGLGLYLTATAGAPKYRWM